MTDHTRWYNVIAGCNDSDYTSHLRMIGYKHDSSKEKDRISSYCPPGYCAEVVVLPKHATPEYLDFLICGKRTGELCQCRENYSIYFHSNNFDCHSDKNYDYGSLLYLVSEILPTTIFFVVIVFLDVSFTDGTINGLVFYFQITDLFFQKSGSSVLCH